MIFSLLEGETNAPAGGGDWWTYVILAVVAVAFIVLFIVLPSRKRKKQEKDAQDLINAVGPETKLKQLAVFAALWLKLTTKRALLCLKLAVKPRESAI